MSDGASEVVLGSGKVARRGVGGRGARHENIGSKGMVREQGRGRAIGIFPGGRL